MSMVMQSHLAESLKRTLEGIEMDRRSPDVDYPGWTREMSMEDAYIDYLEWSGPGFAAEKSEGGDIPTATMKAGPVYRAWARTYALQIVISEEALEDGKYPEIVRAGRMLRNSMQDTVDLDCTNILARAFNSDYVGGDDVELCSTAHPLAQGGTFSNEMATPETPSRSAVITATTNLMDMPGHNGIIKGYRPKQVLHPNAQWAVWEELINSAYAPEAGEYNRINVVNYSITLTHRPLRFLQSTDTNWFVTTNHESPIRMAWRRRPRSKSWVENSNEVMIFKVSARWANLWTNPRCIYGVAA
jgi:hypothetical protein